MNYKQEIKNIDEQILELRKQKDVFKLQADGIYDLEILSCDAKIDFTPDQFYPEQKHVLLFKFKIKLNVEKITTKLLKRMYKKSNLNDLIKKEVQNIADVYKNELLAEIQQQKDNECYFKYNKMSYSMPYMQIDLSDKSGQTILIEWETRHAEDFEQQLKNLIPVLPDPKNKLHKRLVF